MAQTQQFDIYNPSAYQSPDLPQVAPPPDPQAAQKQPQYPQPSTYPGKLGSAALIANDIMTGFSSGLAKAQMMNAQKLQRTSQALQASYKLAANNFSDLATSMNLTPQQLQLVKTDRRPEGLTDDQWKNLQTAKLAVDGSFGSWYKWQGQHIEPEKGSKGKNKKGQQGGQPQQQQGNFLTRIAAAMRGGDTAAVSREVYQFWGSNGPPVYHQLDAQLAQSTQRAAQEKLQTTQTANQQAQQDALASRDKILNIPEDQRTPEQKQALASYDAIITPIPKGSTAKLYESPDGAAKNWFVPGSEPEGWNAIGSAASHPIKYDTATDTIFDPSTNKRYSPNDPSLPPEIAGMFAGVKRALQNKTVTTTGEHTVMVQQTDGSTIPIQVETTSTRTPGGAASSSTPPTPASSPAAALNPYSNPEAQPPAEAFAFNKGWAKPGPYVTKLAPEQEQQFQKWITTQDPQGHDDLNSSTSGYDYRGYWLAMTKGDPITKQTRSAWDGKMHGTDRFKTPYNGSFSNESEYAIQSEAPHWTPDGKLVTKDGRLVVDETPKQKVGSAKVAPAPASRPHAGVIGIGQPVGGKKTGAQTDADKQYNNAVAIAQLAAGVLKTMKSGNDVDIAAAEKLYVGMLQKASEGRFNQGAYDNLSKKYGLGQRFEQWLNDVSSGKLPDEVARGLLKDAGLILQSAKARKESAYKVETPTPKQTRNSKEASPYSPETHQFSVKAWKAANPNGDVEAAKQEATAQGFEIVDDK